MITIRQAHPSNHDENIRLLLEKALTEEVLIPCPDRATAKTVRARFYSLLRAHKEWETPEHLEGKYSGFRSKLISTSKVVAVRPGYIVSPSVNPWTLVIDYRDDAANAVLAAVSSVPSVSMTRSDPKLAHVDNNLSDLPDEDAGPNFLDIMDRYMP